MNEKEKELKSKHQDIFTFGSWSFVNKIDIVCDLVVVIKLLCLSVIVKPSLFYLPVKYFERLALIFLLINLAQVFPSFSVSICSAKLISRPTDLILQ